MTTTRRAGPRFRTIPAAGRGMPQSPRRQRASSLLCSCLCLCLHLCLYLCLYLHWSLSLSLSLSPSPPVRSGRHRAPRSIPPGHLQTGPCRRRRRCCRDIRTTTTLHSLPPPPWGPGIFRGPGAPSRGSAEVVVVVVVVAIGLDCSVRSSSQCRSPCWAVPRRAPSGTREHCSDWWSVRRSCRSGTG